jgi:hypothetical protein
MLISTISILAFDTIDFHQQKYLLPGFLVTSQYRIRFNGQWRMISATASRGWPGGCDNKTLSPMVHEEGGLF